MPSSARLVPLRDRRSQRRRHHVLLAAVATGALILAAPLGASAGTPAVDDDAASASAQASQGTTAATAAQAAAPAVDRIGGADRYAVAVKISQAAYPGTNGIVFLVTGENYPDALGAAPAAVHLNGPLLLTNRTAVPQAVADEIVRLNANLVVIVGGPNSVSTAVETQLGNLATHPAVSRVEGTDRYDTSRRLIHYAYGTTASTFAYVATGANFPDALSAGAAAGAADAPVLLVDGRENALDAASSGLLTSYDFDTIKIAGGTAAVSSGIAFDLDYLFPTIVRLDGADRYQASISINRNAYKTADRVFLATGATFPDALAGAAFAGKVKAPLYVVPGTCVPPGVLADITNLGVKKVTLLGGPAALSPAVEALQPCGGPE